MIFLCFIQNLTIAGSKEDFKSFFPNKAPQTSLVRFGTPSNFCFKLGFQKGLFIDFALRQGLKQPLPNFFL
jgi:hypothetical protein